MARASLSKAFLPCWNNDDDDDDDDDDDGVHDDVDCDQSCEMSGLG